LNWVETYREGKLGRREEIGGGGRRERRVGVFREEAGDAVDELDDEGDQEEEDPPAVSSDEGDEYQRNIEGMVGERGQGEGGKEEEQGEGGGRSE
jgi:hypothetical protein